MRGWIAIAWLWLMEFLGLAWSQRSLPSFSQVFNRFLLLAFPPIFAR